MKKKKQIAIIGGTIAAAFVGFLFLSGMLGQNSMITVNYYDAQGNQIPRPLFTVVTSGTQRIEGVSSVDFDVNAKNTGELPLNVVIDIATPSVLKAAMPTTELTANPGQTVSWKSSRLQTSQFEGTSLAFTVGVTGKYTYAGQQRTISTSGSTASMTFTRDPVVGLEVSVSGGGFGNGTLGTNGTLKTSGTTCTLGSECQSGTCNNVTTQTTLFSSYCSYSATDGKYYATGNGQLTDRQACPASCSSCSTTLGGTTIVTQQGQYVQCSQYYDSPLMPVYCLSNTGSKACA